MAKQTINIGASPNDGTGTPLRTAFDYTNQNFTELYTATGPSGNNIVVPGTATITGDLTVDTNVLKVDTTNNRVGIGTASPATDLHIQAAGSASAEIRLAAAGGRSYNIGSTAGGYGSANNLIIYDITGSAERYRLDGSGNHFWNNVGGVAGTAMTLNSTGLAIGDSPSYKLHVTASSRAAGANYSTSAMEASTVAYVRGAENDLSKASTLLLTQFNGSAAISAGYTATYRSFLAFGVNNGSASVVESMRLDYLGNVGIGVAPSAWGAGYTALQNRQTSWFSTSARDLNLGANVYVDAVGYKYIAASQASLYTSYQGAHTWYTAAAGAAANDPITAFASAKMTLDVNGNLILLSSATPATLATNGQLTVNATSNTNLRFSYRGSDGTTRVANITLA
jgi:hypothetical protein